VTAAAPSLAGLFQEHPVRPIDPQDPLTRQDGIPAHDAAAGSARPRIGYACLWEAVPETTWSGSAWNMRAGLQAVADVTDVGVQIPRLSRLALKAIHTKYRGGRLTTSWSYSRLTDAYNMRALRREFKANPRARDCDAVVMIDDLAVLSVPFFVYYDSSWDALISANDSAEAYAALRLITPSTMERRRQHQLAVYERAAGVVAMSHWFARSLVEQSGLAPEKVHVVHPGFSAGWALKRSQDDITASSGPGHGAPLWQRPSPRRRLLFIGRQYHSFDFYRKGGDLVVAALAVLRRDYDPEITLTIVGPEKWPLPGSLPEGVRFLGPQPASAIPALYDSHDLFVMPSRLEPFGVVFAEALSRGLPCVARDACAMPEIVTPGVSGALLGKDDEHELAVAIAAVLADDSIYEACSARAPQIARYFSWDRSAAEMVQVIVGNS
jgi:glycosyltransferase involved in cell wall biosynthesis